MDCIFCKIIDGSAPARKIYEDEHTLAFLDIAKDVDGHTVVVPKRHVMSILDCDTETLMHFIRAVKAISNHYTENCGYDGVNLLNASGKAAQQSVFHLHFHIIPRKNNDGINAWPVFTGSKLSHDEMHKILKMQAGV